MKEFVVATLLAFGANSAFAQVEHSTEVETVTAPSKSNYVMCKNSSQVRTIRIEKNGRSCRTTYTKDGVDATVGKSATEDLCREVLGKIRDNLEKASWKCKDISQSRVSISTVEP